jgi:hypothetical protein
MVMEIEKHSHAIDPVLALLLLNLRNWKDFDFSNRVERQVHDGI